MKLHRLLLLGTVVVVVAAVASGCGGGNGSSENEAESTPTSGSGSVVKTITIDETEYKLTPSAVSLEKPGTYEFKAVNKGSTAHALEVEGSDEKETEDIEPGKSATVEVSFDKAGKYEMYCPVDGHRQQGMEGEITVGSSGGAAPSATEGTTTSETETEMETDTSGGGGY
jgi:plastocyanin